MDTSLEFALLHSLVETGRKAEDLVWLRVAQALDAEGDYEEFDSIAALQAADAAPA